MPERMTKEILYAKLEEIRLLAEFARDTHHHCIFNIQIPGKRYGGCLLPEVPYAPGPACGEPTRPIPEHVLEALQDLADKVEEAIGQFSRFYDLKPRESK